MGGLGTRGGATQSSGAGLACAPRKRKVGPVSGRLIRGLVLSQAAHLKIYSWAGHAFWGSLLGDSAGSAQFRQRSPLLRPRLAAAGWGEPWPLSGRRSHPPLVRGLCASLAFGKPSSEEALRSLSPHASAPWLPCVRRRVLEFLLSLSPHYFSFSGAPLQKCSSLKASLLPAAEVRRLRSGCQSSPGLSGSVYYYVSLVLGDPDWAVNSWWWWLLSRSLVPDSWRLQYARLPCPSLSPGACSDSRPLNQWCRPTVSSSIARPSLALTKFLDDIGQTWKP